MLGVVPGERSFFHENERNDQERSHRSKKKNERIERVLKNIGTICKVTEQEGNDWKKALILERNIPISKQSERAQPYPWIEWP